jgi:hypothetical protein
VSIGPTQRWLSARSVGVFLLAVVLLAPGFSFALKDPSGNTDADASAGSQPTAPREDPVRRAEWFMRGRRIKGENSAALLHRAFKQKIKLRQTAQQREQQSAVRTLSGSASASTTSAANLSGVQSAPLSQPAWQNLGPAPISGMGQSGDASGRTTSVAVDQCDATGNTIYISGADGGVWRSTNAAAVDPTTVTWTALYDTDPAAATLSAAAIGLQPGNCTGTTSNLILAGTGEPNNSGDSYYGQGILRSTDGGVTWSLITSANSGVNSFRGMGVSKFAFSTTNPNLVVAGLSNTPLGAQSDACQPTTCTLQGPYYSTDAGATWHKGTTPDTISGSVTDVVFNPALGKFFAAFKKQGFYSSTDGINWTRLANQPVTFTASCQSAASPTCDISRGQLTVLPGSADMYAWVVGSSGSNKGISKTTNGGTAAWTVLSTAGIISCGDGNGCGASQGSYNLYLGAVPAAGGSTDLYAGAINVFKCNIPSGTTTSVCGSTTPGATVNKWLNLTHVYGFSACDPGYLSIHPDQHGFDFLRVNPNIIYFTNDGGTYRTLNGPGMTVIGCGTPTKNPFDDLNTSSLGSLNQFVAISQHPSDPTILLGGTQDNGSPAFSTDQPTPLTPPQWYEAWGGDGGYNAIDQTNPQFWYATNTDVPIWKCVDGTACLESKPFCNGAAPGTCNPLVDNNTVGGDHGAFYTPFILDPGNQNRIIIGTCRIWRGDNTGSGFTAISPDFEPGGFTPCNGGEINLVRSLAAGGDVLAGVSSVIYAGTDTGNPSFNTGGHIWVTTNGFDPIPTWTDTTGSINPGSFPISYIAVDPHDTTGHTAYITIMGFTGDPGGAGHVFKTTNAGGNWTDIGVGLPDAPADSIAVDPRDANIIYAANDVGVFVTKDGGATWQEYGTGLPNITPTSMLIFNSGGTQKLRIGTYGRGVWQTDLVSINDYSLTIPDPVVSVRPGQTAHFAVTAARSGTFASAVALSCVPDPPATGTTCSLSPTSADLALNTSVPITLDVPTNAGTTTAADHVFNLHGDGGAITHDLALTLRVNDFTIGSSTTQQTIEQTGTATYTVTITPQGNFTDPIALSCANFSSAGLSCSFSQNNFGPGTSPVNVTVTLTAGGNAALGTGTFDVVATSGSTVPSISLAYNVILAQDFTFVGGITDRAILAGNSGDYTATLTPLNSFSASNMTMSCTGQPENGGGGACSFTPPAPSISSATPLPLAIAVPTTPSTGSSYIITATALDAASGKTHSIHLTLSVGNFTVAATPSSRTVAVGAGSTYTVNVTGQNGYAGLITLGCNALPANVTCSFSPAAVTPGTPSTLTVLTTSSVTVGTKIISVTGTAEGQTRTAANVTLSVSSTTPSFTLTMSAPTKTVNLGASTTFSLNVKSTTTTSPGSVTLSCPLPLPTGVTCPTFSPASLTPNTTGTNVTATVQTSNSTSVANLPITFKAATTAQLRQINGTLQVQDYAVGVSPSSQVIPAPGGTTQYTVTLTGLNGFATSTNLSCTGLPAGWTCGFVPAAVTPTGTGATSTLTLTTAATPFGPSNFTVQATAGSLTHTQLISATNGSNDYQLVNTGAALVAVRPGQTANYSIQLNRFGSFSGQVNESCVYTSTTPVGTACNITPNPADLTTVTCPGSGLCTTASLAIPTNSGTTVIGDYALNFHGNGNGSLHDVPLSLRVNDFSIASATTSQTIQQTATGTYNVTVTGLNNWTANVGLSCANFTTTGLGCTFSQNNFVPAPGGTNVTVTLTAAGNAAPGAGTFDVVATDGATSHAKNLGYTVTLVQDFTFGNVTGQQSVLPGQTANYSTTLTPLNAFSANVNLVCSGLPLNSSCVFSPVSPVPIGSATPQPVTASIVTTNTTPAGDSVVTVTATDPVSLKSHAVNLSLRVQSFTLASTPTSRTIPAGAGTTFSVGVTAQNGLTLPVTLSCVAPPTGLTCTPPAAVTPGTSGTMFVQAASSTTAGTKTLTISGTTGFGVPIVNQNVSVAISTTTPSFTITTSTPTKVVPQGSSTTFTLSVKSTLTTSPGTVTMSCVAPLPTGVACSFSPSSFTPTTTARTVTATVTTTGATPAQSFPLQFQAATASQFKRVNGTLQVADYTFDVQPPTRTVSSATGGTASYTATLTSIDGFATSTALSCTGLPAGWTCGFSPASVTPSGSGATSTLTLTTTNNPLGPQNFTISAIGGGITHTQQVQVINGQDFTISVFPPITVNQNSSNTTTVNVAAVGTFASSVALSCVNPPAGISCGFVPAAITPGTPSTLTISASSAVPGAAYDITIQGQSSSPALTHTVDEPIDVPDFSVSLGGAGNTVLRTRPLVLSGTATALGTFSSSVTFSCSTGDANVPCVAQTPVTPLDTSSPVSVTVTPNGSATIGPYTVMLTGNDGAGHVHSASFGITVQDFSVAATDAASSVENGTTTGNYSGTITGAGFTGNVALTCSSPTISVTCAFSPSSTIAASALGTAYTFTITPTGAVGGPYVVNVSGTSGGVTHTATVHVSITASQDWSYTYQLSTPQTQSVNAGQSAAYNIDLSPNNGFNSSVVLTCSVTGAPAGMSCNIAGSPVAGGSGSITLNVLTTNGTVAPGAYSIVVSGTGGAKTRTTTATLNVRDFTLNVTPPTQTVTAGATADYTVSTATTSAFANNAALTCAVLTAPAGTGCTFDASPIAPGGSTTMHVSSTVATPAASYTVQVTATSGATVHTFNVTYTVNNGAASDFTITTSTPTRTVTHGSTTSYTVTVTATGSFAESVTLSCLGQPAGVACGTANFVPSTSGTIKTLNVLVSSTTVPGTYNFQIKGTSATKLHTVAVQLIVN